MQIIIDPFDKFPLMTKKLNDFKLFKLAYNLFIKNKNNKKRAFIYRGYRKISYD